MDEGRPSRSALRVALRRAAHQLYDRPLVFDDPFALTILDAEAREDLKRTPTRSDRPFSKALRAFLVARSRFAEDTLRAEIATGISQYVLLGAGLDTFGCRNTSSAMRVFEVDHPTTQRWKRNLLARQGIAVPESLRFVPVDFEQQTLSEELLRSGFDPGQKTIFACLGVVPYLSHEAFTRTVRFVEGMPHGSGLVMDYSQPRSVLPPLEQLAHDSLASRVRLAGEPFQLFLTQGEMKDVLGSFSMIQDLGSDELNALYFKDRSDGLAVRGRAGRLVCAWR